MPDPTVGTDLDNYRRVPHDVTVASSHPRVADDVSPRRTDFVEAERTPAIITLSNKVVILVLFMLQAIEMAKAHFIQQIGDYSSRKYPCSR